MENIRDILWDEDCTGMEEYLQRRSFYGNLNKICNRPSGDLDFKEELLSRAESLQSGVPDLSYTSTGAAPIPDKFGWEEGYTWGMRQYLKHGVESFNTYDK